jgi:hypothetical protein
MAGYSTSCYRAPEYPVCNTPGRSACCAVPSCSLVFNTKYEPVDLDLAATAQPLSVTPLSFTLPKKSAVTMTFTGSVCTTKAVAQPAATISVVLAYINTSDPTTVYEQAVPVLVTVPVTLLNAGPIVCIPVASTIGACLPCGAYELSVSLSTVSGAVTVSVSGTLSVTPYM